MKLPEIFAGDIPPSCQQVVLVRSEKRTYKVGRMWLLDRSVDGAWFLAHGPFPVSLGRQGMAWGAGGHRAKAPSGWRMKREGDDCTPAGVFKLPYAFGYASKARLGLPYVALTESFAGVDDSQSRYYNQVVDASKVKRDWTRAEVMRGQHSLYQWGVFVAHNEACRPGVGSCIFMHHWEGEGIGTAGCTAMSPEVMQTLLKWLRSDAQPLLLQSSP